MKKIISQIDTYSSFFEKLKATYAAMDQKYDAVSNEYGFLCTGCKDNCCLTRFYHHTFLEYFYIIRGYSTLEPERQAEVEKKALDVRRKTAEADEKGLHPVRLMCPLNADGLCLLYTYRPMICRLHGIPHEIRRPGQNVIHSPGCDAFTDQCGKKAYVVFDRTPFYVEMAALERDLRQVLGSTQKLKLTIAEMLEVRSEE